MNFYLAASQEEESKSIVLESPISFLRPNMEVDEDIPVCTSCGHRHIQGIKCHICGHVGRSQIYQKMRLRANEKRGLKVFYFDGPNFDDKTSDWDIVSDIRRRVYCEEMGVPLDMEVVPEVERSSRHVIGFIGDAPYGVARFRLITLADSRTYAYIDRLAVLPQYRLRGFGKTLLNEISSNIKLLSQGTGVHTIAIGVPADSTIAHKLETLHWVVDRSVPLESRGPWLQATMIFLGT